MNADWLQSTPEAEAMDGELLNSLGPFFDGWTDANLHGVVIARRGRLVYERYFTGEDQIWGRPLGRVSYSAGMRHDMRSISKSVLSLLIGLAVDRGLIGDLDRSIFAVLPQYADLQTEANRGITLRHLLTMSAGLAWNEQIPYADPRNSERAMSDAADRGRFVLQQPIARPPGATYNYNGGCTALLGLVLAKAAAQPIDAFAAETLFAPLGIVDIEWVRYSDGAANPVSGLRLRPRDIARIGQLVLDRGRWQDRQILSAQWIAESTAPQVNGEALYFYGYQWWLGRSLVRRREIRWIAAVGYGGQRLFIVPDCGLVVAVMAGLYGNPVLQSIVGEVVLRRFALAALRD